MTPALRGVLNAGAHRTRPCLSAWSTRVLALRAAPAAPPPPPPPLRPRRAAATAAAAASSAAPSADAGAADGSAGAYDYDLFCIGAGSGGVRAARVAAGTYGARVAVCEMPFSTIASDEAGGAGGTCVLRGCVPKKLFVYCAEYAAAMKDAEGFGWRLPGAPSLDWPAFLAAKNAELHRLNGVYGSLLKGSGVDYVEGRGRLVDAHTVEVGGRRYTARHVLLATGGRAVVPAFEGSEHAIISDAALELPAVPRSIAIIGGGYIAVEFAGVFAALGAETHVVLRQHAPLRGFDEEVRDFAAAQFAQNGLVMHPRREPKAIRPRPGGGYDLVMSCCEGGADETLAVDVVMAATGRRPNVAGLGLEAAGVALTPGGAVAVDEFSRTSAPSVWAIGDVTDRKALTPVALMEAMALAKTLFGGGAPVAPDYADIATAVFSHPQVATVGLTEEQAAAAYPAVDVYSSSFRPMRNTISGNPGRALMKLVVDAASGRVLGAHAVGPDVGEIMQGIGACVKLGVTKAQLDSVVGIHPTAAEEFVTMRTVTRQLRREPAAAAAA